MPINKVPRIVKGKKEPPERILLYAEEGVGKSTFAGDAEDPLFLDLDRSTDHMDVARIGDANDPKNPPPATYDEVVQAIMNLHNIEYRAIYDDTGKVIGTCKSLVIDTIDRLEQLIHKEVVKRYKPRKDEIISDITDIGFNGGYLAAMSIWTEFFVILDALQMQTQMNVILLAHASKKKVTNLRGEDYTTYEPALYAGNNANAAEMVREWCEGVFFAYFDDLSKKNEDPLKKKAVGKGVTTGKHWMITCHTGWCMAKNRYNLPEKMMLSYREYKNLKRNYYLSANIDLSEADLKSEIQKLIAEIQTWESEDWFEEKVSKALAHAGNNIPALKNILLGLRNKAKQKPKEIEQKVTEEQAN